MKKYFSKVSSYFISFFASMWVAILIGIIFKIPFDMITNSGVLGGRLFLGILLTVAPSFYIFLSMKKKGYKDAAVDPYEIAVCLTIIFLIQQLLSYIIGYAIYLSGGAANLAEALFLKGSEAIYENSAGFPLWASTAKDVPLWSYHLIMLLTELFIFCPAFIAGINSGVKKRLKERAELQL